MTKKSSTVNVSGMILKSITFILGIIVAGVGCYAIWTAKTVPQVGEGIHMEFQDVEVEERRVLEENAFLLTSSVFLFLSLISVSCELMTDVRKGWKATVNKMFYLVAGIFLCLGNFLLIHAAKIQDDLYGDNYSEPVYGDTWKGIVRNNTNYVEKIAAGSLGVVNGLVCFLGGILILKSGLHVPAGISKESPYTIHL